MNLWDFLAGSLWPIVVIVVAFIYKTPVTNLISRIKSANIAGAKFDTEALEQASDELKTDTVSAKIEPKLDAANSLDQAEGNALLAKVSPAALVMQSYRSVEIALRNLFVEISKGDNIAGKPRYRNNPVETLRYLSKNQKIPDSLAHVLQELRTLRNKVVHDNHDVSANAALAYAESADLAASTLRTLNPKNTFDPQMSLWSGSGNSSAAQP